MTLDELPLHTDATIVECHEVRFGDLGCSCGTVVRVIAKAPFGGPIAFRVGSDTFAFRREEAKKVIVELL